MVTAELPFPPEADPALDRKSYAWHNVSQIYGDLPDDSGWNATLVKDSTAVHVVDECSVRTQNDPVFGNEVGKIVKPPRWAGGHQHHADAGVLDRSQRSSRPFRADAIAAKQGAIQVRGHQAGQTCSRHLAVTPPTT